MAKKRSERFLGITQKPSHEPARHPTSGTTEKEKGRYCIGPSLNLIISGPPGFSEAVPRSEQALSSYHLTGSFSKLPSAASSAVNVAPRYCTQSITRGASPELRTERLPAGATRTTLPSVTGKTLPST